VEFPQENFFVFIYSEEIVMKTFRNWMSSHFDLEALRDMVNHGVASGFTGLIHYHETAALYKEFQDDIWEMMEEDAEAYGFSILELIASFPRSKKVCIPAQLENLLVWYAAEKIACEIVSQNDDI
jgi:hypothetical protein